MASPKDSLDIPIAQLEFHLVEDFENVMKEAAASQQDEITNFFTHTLTNTSSTSDLSNTLSLTFTATPLDKVPGTEDDDFREFVTATTQSKSQKSPSLYQHALLLKSPLQKASLIDTGISKDICGCMRQENPPLQLNKAEKYQFGEVQWLSEELKERLKEFEKLSRKLLNALIFLSNNIQLFEAATKKYPDTTNIPTVLKCYVEAFSQLKSSRVFSTKRSVTTILEKYGNIAKSETPENIAPTTIQLLVKFDQYESEEAYGNYRTSQLKLSGDYYIRQAEMKQVWEKIEATAINIQNSITRLTSKDTFFTKKIQTKQDQAQTLETLIKNLGQEYRSNTYKEDVTLKLRTNLDTITRSRLTFNDTSTSLQDISPESLNPILPNPSLLDKVEEAIAFSKELNWCLCEVAKWIEQAQISIKAASASSSSPEKKEKDRARFEALQAAIQAHFNTMQTEYTTHTMNLKEIIRISEKPLEKNGINFLFKQGKTVQGVIGIARSRAANLEASRLNVALIEDQWSQLATRIRDLALTIKGFAASSLSNSSSSRYSSWYWS